MKTTALSTEQGHIALYAALVAPVIVSLGVLAVDLSGWNALRQTLQKEADRIALQVVQVLPDRVAAQSLVGKLASSLNIPGVRGRAYFGGDKNPGGLALSVQLEANYRSAFDFFIKPLTGEQFFSVAREGVVQIAPTDTVLILADGHTLRPSLRTDTVDPGKFIPDTPWGDAADWPASGYFGCALEPRISSDNAEISGGFRWWEGWKSSYPRWATQACFNPVLSPYKSAAITIADSLVAFSGNRLGLIFTPGLPSGAGFAVSRFLQGEVKSQGEAHFAGRIGGYFDGDSAVASWLNYYEPETGLGDEACILFSDPATSLNYRYTIPEAAVTLPASGASASCSEALPETTCGVRHTSTSHVLNSCYRDSALRLREAIYWHAARSAQPGFDAEPNLLAAIKGALGDIAAVSGNTLLNNDIGRRGNLAYLPTRQIIALTDSLSTSLESELDELGEILRATNTDLVVIGFSHLGLDSARTVTLKGALLTLASRAEQLSATGDPSPVRVFSVDSPEALLELVPKILTASRKVTVRS